MKLDERGHGGAPASLRHLPRWQQLVSASWLAALLAGEAVAAAPTGAWRLFEVGYDTLESFHASHIPGAGYLDTRQLEQGPLWNKVPDRALLQLLLEHGIRHDTSVILYGRNNLAAARAAHLMLYAGVTDVRLLDGGFATWNEGALPAAAGAPARFLAAQDFGAAFPAHPEYLIDTRQAKALLRRGDGALVSIRTWKEFIGQTSGYAYIAATGDIPGAHWGRAGDDGDVNSMSDFHRPDGTMKAPERNLRLLAQGRHPCRAADGVLLRYRLARLARVFLCLADELGAHQRL